MKSIAWKEITTMTQNTPNKLLEVRGLTMDFGGLRAMDSVSLDIYAVEIVALIGPNGAD